MTTPVKKTARRPANVKVLKEAPNDTHEALSGYITRTTGQEIDALTVSIVQRLYPLYLKSPDVLKAKEALKAARDAEAAAREATKRARLTDRLERLEAERQKVLEDLGYADKDDEPEEVPVQDSGPVEPAVKRKRPLEAVAVEPKPEPEPEDEGDDEEWDDDDDNVVEAVEVEDDEEDEDDWADEDETDEEDF